MELIQVGPALWEISDRGAHIGYVFNMQLKSWRRSSLGISVILMDKEASASLGLWIEHLELLFLSGK